jgi:hypothetical protein
MYTLLMAVVCSYGTTHGQTLASWSLTSNATPTVMNTNAQASFFSRGNGITTPAYGGSGAASLAWETSQEASSEDYFEICINPKPGHTLVVNGLIYTESRSSEGIRAYDLRWSKDGFKASNLLASFTVPDDLAFRSNNLNNLGISVCAGETLCFRWYGYQAETNEGEWRLANIVLNGASFPLCSPHTNPAWAMNISNVTNNSMNVSWTRGNGDGVVVLARAGAAPEVSLCDWQISSVSPVFGLGTNLGNGAYVVYEGLGSSFTLQGLAEGTQYHLAAYEYSGLNFCLNTNALIPRANATTTCSQPAPVASLNYSATDQGMYLSWQLPPCYEQVMVVASSQPITAAPTSTDPSVYTASAIFGNGTDSSGDFLSPASPVYRGSGQAVAIEGLNNGQLYYFRIFTFRADQWAAGAQVSAKAVAGCSELGDGGRVFINEIHYQNSMVDVDEGIEIVGPAGTKLENYALAIYGATRTLDKLIYLSGTIDDEGQGYGAVWVPVPNIFEVGAIALYNLVADIPVEFLSWRDNVFTAVDGPVQGETATPIGVREDPFTPLNYSLQRIGQGNCPSGMTWQGPMLSSRGLINTGQSLLPIQLAYFEGRLIGDQVLLNWATVSEEQNDFMAVEHSMDGRSFREIGRVKGAGTTILPQSYELWHDQPLPGINYYRLRQVDFDGQFEYFSAIAIEYRPGQTVFKVYPTLAAERLTVELSTPRQSPGELVLFNLYGQPLQRLAVPDGGLRREISLDALPPGHYLIQWQPHAGEPLVQRFVKQ